ncbi:hypothetical protein BKA69DRAFT_1037290 [Paraphysoderma sedebokerense]|nr:hypothetical protein BKA69DRAFT_1037290 [Paraphysoderma sedebokerense]
MSFFISYSLKIRPAFLSIRAQFHSFPSSLAKHNIPKPKSKSSALKNESIVSPSDEILLINHTGQYIGRSLLSKTLQQLKSGIKNESTQSTPIVSFKTHELVQIGKRLYNPVKTTSSSEDKSSTQSQPPSSPPTGSLRSSSTTPYELPLCKIIPKPESPSKLSTQPSSTPSSSKSKPKPPGITEKEVQISTIVSTHDYETKLNKIRYLLQKGHRVKITVIHKKIQTPSRTPPIRISKQGKQNELKNFADQTLTLLKDEIGVIVKYPNNIGESNKGKSTNLLKVPGSSLMSIIVDPKKK